MLENLINLARDSSDEKRLELVEHVTALFAARAHKNNPDETKTFNALLEGVFEHLDTKARQKISERLAGIGTISRDLAMRLAADDVTVARPMLEKSQALSDQDLLALSKTASQEHLLAISSRDHLNEAVTEALIKRGSEKVRKNLAMNFGAELSMANFERLIKELPRHLGDKARHLRKSNEELVRDLFRDPAEVMAGGPLEKRETRFSAKQWVIGIRRGQVNLNRVIFELAFDKNLYAIALVLSALTGISHKHVTNMIIRYDSTGISTLCRAMGINDGEYAVICKARCGHLRFPESTGSKWVTNYHMMAPVDARRLLGLLKIKLQCLEAIAA